MGKTIVKKLSMKTVTGGPAAIRALPDGPIARIFGIADDSITGEGDNGPWVGFKGTFEAINLKTGEIFNAAKCFLPGCASDLIENALKSNPDSDGVQFGFDIVKTTNDSSAVGYDYSARPLIESGKSDPLATMANAFPALPVLALPEPTSDPAPKTHSEQRKIKK